MSVVVFLCVTGFIVGMKYRDLADCGNGPLKILRTSCRNTVSPVSSFSECVAAGNPVLESYPRQCVSQGKTFAEDIGNELEKQDLIRISEPRPNQTVTLPLVIRGEARGTWFFEGSFPFELRDPEGAMLAAWYAQADGEWMTEDFVPFHAVVDIAPDLGIPQEGILVFKKDNPSGLPEHDDQLIMPLQLRASPGGSTDADVFVYFSDIARDPGMQDCGAVRGVRRIIGQPQNGGSRTEFIESLVRDALQWLFAGPTNLEQMQGLITNVNARTGILSIAYDRGTLSVDFDINLEVGAAGSCRVTAIRAQIEQTLLGIPGVERALVSVEGRTEDILQP